MKKLIRAASGRWLDKTVSVLSGGLMLQSISGHLQVIGEEGDLEFRRCASILLNRDDFLGKKEIRIKLTTVT